MRVFADSSAVVKIYADEEGSDEVRQLDSMYVAEMARVEVAAALWRKVRMGFLELSRCDRLILRCEDDFDLETGLMIPVSVDRAGLRHACLLAGVHGLRAYDAVQLASAIKVRSVDPECQIFAAFDVELLGAAEAEGFVAF